MTPIDISPADLETVRQILREKVPELEVRAFGSRASWTARETSDLDLVLMTKEPLDISCMTELKESFSESSLPFRVDILDWADTSENFRKIIKNENIVIQEDVKNNRVAKNGWKRMSFGEAVLVNPSVVLKRGKTYPFVNMADINPNSKFAHAVGQREYSGNGSHFQADDTLMARITPCLENGKIACYRPTTEEKTAHGSTEFIVIRGRPDVTYTEFAYYLTQWKKVRSHAVNQMTGTSRRQRVPVKSLCHLSVPVPPLHEQHLITHVLGTLDHKIELNGRTSETLEAMARALFKSWFVDFDPVRAKMEGRWRKGKSLPSLPAHLYGIFPNQLVDSELGQIPDGWKIKTLKGLCHKPQYGYTESAKNEPVGPKFLRITDINKKSWIDWRTVPYCKITEKDFDKYRLRKGDIIIARMADPGHGVMIEEDREAVFASYMIRFRPIGRLYARILQYWLRSDRYWELVLERSTGTTRANLNAKVMSSFPLVVPSPPVAEAFNEYVNSMRTRVTANALESHSLKTVRDTLLPELMSGRLDVEKIKGLENIPSIY